VGTVGPGQGDTPVAAAGAAVGPADVVGAARAVAACLGPVADADWRVPAGSLAWDCRRTVDHLPDTLLLYAAHLASRAERGLPSVRTGDPVASPRRLLVVTTSAAHVLAAVATAAPPDARAFHPAGFADPAGFCAMACDELLIHGHDLAAGLGLGFDAPPGLPRRVLGRLFPEAPSGADPWTTLLWANGRADLPGVARRGPDWTWQAAPGG